MSQNSYHTLKDMRVVFVDGTVLDTADPQSCAAFLKVCERATASYVLCACALCLCVRCVSCTVTLSYQRRESLKPKARLSGAPPGSYTMPHTIRACYALLLCCTRGLTTGWSTPASCHITPPHCITGHQTVLLPPAVAVQSRTQL